MLYYLSILASLLVSFTIGFFFVSFLRKKCSKVEDIWKLSAFVFVFPIAIYIICNITSTYKLCDKMILDSTAFGILIGILINLSLPPKGQKSIQLVVYQLDGNKHTIWLDSSDILVGDARNTIAQALHIVPASKLSIESGKGTFLNDLSVKLFPSLNGSFVTKDLFGFTSAFCYIHIKEDDEIIPLAVEEEKSPRDRANTFRSLLGNIKGVVKYGQHFTLTAKVSSAEGAGLFVAPVNSFAAAAPIHQLAVPSILSSAMYVRIISWNAVSDSAGQSVAGSEFGDHKSDSGRSDFTSYPHSVSPSQRIMQTVTSKLYKNSLEFPAEPIRNGDIVVIECDGK